MAKSKTSYFCSECGTEAPKWFGRCTSCGAFNTAVESERITGKATKQRPSLGAMESFAPPVPITEISHEDEPRIRTGLLEFDRVLGGGIVPGSVTLLGGDPGIGKSTLLLQVADTLARRGLRILYVSGEESGRQLRLRAERLQCLTDNLLVMTRTVLEEILAEPSLREVDFVIVDSLQSLGSIDLDAAAGSVSQVREVAVRLTHFAKSYSVPVLIIGHVTKEGSIAGPKLVEHVVDTVLYFEGDMHHAYRVLRTEKNRFGPAHELGVFEMAGGGLREVANPSALFVTHRSQPMTGAVVCPTLEGTRPLLAEIQALVAPCAYGGARRVATGFDVRRVHLLAAVLEKHLHLPLQQSDIFVNIAAGLRLTDPGMDLGLTAAVLSSYLNVPVDHHTVLVGEVSLTGEIRDVSQGLKRLSEAEKRGYTTALVPSALAEQAKSEVGLRLLSVPSLPALHRILAAGGK